MYTAPDWTPTEDEAREIEDRRLAVRAEVLERDARHLRARFRVRPSSSKYGTPDRLESLASAPSNAAAARQAVRLFRRAWRHASPQEVPTAMNNRITDCMDGPPANGAADHDHAEPGAPAGLGACPDCGTPYRGKRRRCAVCKPAWNKGVAMTRHPAPEDPTDARPPRAREVTPDPARDPEARPGADRPGGRPDRGVPGSLRGAEGQTHGASGPEVPGRDGPVGALTPARVLLDIAREVVEQLDGLPDGDAARVLEIVLMACGAGREAPR